MGSQSNPRIVRIVNGCSRDHLNNVDRSWIGNATVEMVEFHVSILAKLHVVNGNVTEGKSEISAEKCSRLM